MSLVKQSGWCGCLKIYNTIYTPIIYICMLSLLIYANTLQNGFVYDDHDFIEKSEFIRSWKNLLLFFSPGDWKLLNNVDINRPLMTVSLMLDYSLWGLNPLGYHLTNVVLHATNAILFYYLVLQINGLKTFAFFAAIIFSIHPINAEAVNAISYREDLLVTTAFILSFIFGTRSDQPGRKNSVLSLIFFAFALLTKEMAVVLPLIIFLYHKIYDHRGNKLLYLGQAFLIFLYLLFANLLRQESSIYGQVLKEAFPLQDRLEQQGYIFLSYLRLLFFPVVLNADYVTPLKPGIYSVLLLCVVILTCVLITVYTRNKFITFFAAWVLICLLPVSNIFPLTTPMAERYLYLPLLGCFAIIGSAVGYSMERVKRYPMLIFSFVLICLPFALNVFTRNQIWKDDLTLWQDTVLKSPNSEHAHYNLANEYLQKGKLDRAISEYQISINIRPMIDAYVNLGITYKKKNMYEHARLQFDKALAISPQHSLARANLGHLYERMRYQDKAIYEYQEVIKSDPTFVYAHMRLGIIFREQGNIDRAISEFRKVLEIDPGNNAAKVWLEEMSDG